MKLVIVSHRGAGQVPEDQRAQIGIADYAGELAGLSIAEGVSRLAVRVGIRRLVCVVQQ
jgi:hypothetical protein